MPLADTLRHVVVEVAFKECSVRVLPFSVSEVASTEVSYELHASLVEDVSALSLLLAILPRARVDVFGHVDHDPFPMLFSVFPVAIVLTEPSVVLFSNAMFVV